MIDTKNNMTLNTENLSQLFKQCFGTQPSNIEVLPASGSSRQYYRLSGFQNQGHTPISVIGTHSDNGDEGRSFVALTRHFEAQKLPVPALYATNSDNTYYLQQDLGNVSLLSFVEQCRQESQQTWPSLLTCKYQQVIDRLLDFQLTALCSADDNPLMPSLPTFNAQLALWDGQYFKYCFLKPMNIHFDETALETDLRQLADYLAAADSHFFMLRDCQARNIMLLNGDAPYFIDYQGGMKGPLPYDLASLLYQAKAAIPQDIRDQLLQYYIVCLKKQMPHITGVIFEKQFYAFVLIRTLQVLGAYGFRGLFEQKKHFIESIPYALDNIRHLLQTHLPPIALPELFRILTQLAGLQFDAKQWLSNGPDNVNSLPPQHLIPKNQLEPAKVPDRTGEHRTEPQNLTVIVQSFSYKRGIPPDPTGNGGGFVFDCRSLNNPGRHEPYKELTGQDKSVQDFLVKKSHVKQFLQHAYALTDKAVATYHERQLNFLTVNFGCTGGQHRSVYCAEKMAAHLKAAFKTNAIEIRLRHIEQEIIKQNK